MSNAGSVPVGYFINVDTDIMTSETLSRADIIKAVRKISSKEENKSNNEKKVLHSKRTGHNDVIHS